MRNLLLLTLAVAGAASFAGCAEETATSSTFTPESVGMVEQSAVFVNECEAQGTGGELGDRVANFTLQNCYGEEVSLHDYCGRRRAMWLIASAGWCGVCNSYVPEAAGEFREARHQGVEMFVVLGEDTDGAPPTEEYCFHYAEEKGLDPAQILMDPHFSTIWSNVSPGGGGSVGLPFEAVLDPYDMAYVWTNASDPQYGMDVVRPMLED